MRIERLNILQQLKNRCYHLAANCICNQSNFGNRLEGKNVVKEGFFQETIWRCYDVINLHHVFDSLFTVIYSLLIG